MLKLSVIIKAGVDARSSELSGRSSHYILSASGLAVAYRSEPYPAQIDGISFKIAPGEIVAVIGPNGSGKSTLLKALSRTLAPRSGRVLLDDYDLYADLTARQSAHAISVVPQSSGIFLDFTVRDVVAMGRAPHRARRGLMSADTPADARAVADALERSGIGDDLAERPISQVSGGERQRALIARSLAQEAPILLLDEPVSALDPSHQKQLLGWLRELAERERRTIVTVLHDLNAVAEFADRVVVLFAGRLIADGPAAQVLNPQIISDVYGVGTWIRSNPATGRFSILPAEPVGSASWIAAGATAGTAIASHAAQPDSAYGAKPRIHLFCGGGTGAMLMLALARRGYALSACALHEGDADLDAARSLQVPYASAPPFSRPAPDALDFASALADEADIAVYTGVPRGEINAGLFEQAARFAATGKTLICLGDKTHCEQGILDQGDQAGSKIDFAATVAEVAAILQARIAESPPAVDGISPT